MDGEEIGLEGADGEAIDRGEREGGEKEKG